MTAGSVSAARLKRPTAGASRAGQEGVALATDAALLAGASGHARRLTEQLLALAAEEWPVALRITGLRARENPAARLAGACERIRAAYAQAAVDPAALELTIDAAAVPPATAFAVRETILGHGKLNLVIDGLLSRRTWQALWRLRDEPVSLACWPFVTAATRLLGTETADDVLPVTGLQAPRQSAWLLQPLPLVEVVRANATLDVVALETVTDRMFHTALADFGMTAWPTAGMRQDAWLNRRTTLCLTGIGDTARRLGLDPGRDEHVSLLDGFVAGVRRVAVRRSRELAGQFETLPAIELADPCRQLPDNGMRGRWRERWRAAVGRSALAHRNVLVMSPWSLFPSSGPDPHYMNLLPLLRHADACTFRDRPRLDGWNMNKFSELHRRTWALSGARVRACGVAERL